MTAFRSKLTINAANYGYLASNQRLQDCRLNLLAYNLLITCLATASGLPTLQPHQIKYSVIARFTMGPSPRT